MMFFIALLIIFLFCGLLVFRPWMRSKLNTHKQPPVLHADDGRINALEQELFPDYFQAELQRYSNEHDHQDVLIPWTDDDGKHSTHRFHANAHGLWQQQVVKQVKQRTGTRGRIETFGDSYIKFLNDAAGR